MNYEEAIKQLKDFAVECDPKDGHCGRCEDNSKAIEVIEKENQNLKNGLDRIEALLNEGMSSDIYLLIRELKG